MTIEFLRAVLSLLVVLGLIAGLSWVLRRYGNAHLARRAGRRLAVVEALSLDARRRLVLVRRDQAEYLLLLGPQGDLVVGDPLPVSPAFSDLLPPSSPSDRSPSEDRAA